MSDMNIALGIIGAGSIGHIHAQAASKAGLRIAAVCDIDPEKAARLADQHPGAVATASVDELLALENIPGVVIAVPNHLHKGLAIQALEAGRDVLLEKPMAMNLAECDQIIKAAEDSGQLLQLGFVCRYAPAAIAARHLIAQGKLGTILHAKAMMYRRRGIPGLGHWFTTKEKSGGGVLIDIGVHLIDLVMHITPQESHPPRPLRVSAHCTSTFGTPIESYTYEEMWAGPPDPAGTFDVDDGVTGLIRFDTGMTFELNVTWAANLPENILPDGIVILGDRGGCYLDLWNNRLVYTCEVDGKLTDTEIELTTDPEDNAWDYAWRSEHEHFAASIANRTPPEASGADGRTVQQIIEAMYRSSEAGCEVEIE